MKQFKARFYDTRTFLSLRPHYYFSAKFLSKFKPSVYIPGIGYIINDPMLAKSIMKDQEHFSINEGGGLGMLISEIWGKTPNIISMDGDDHKRIKFALLDKFKEENLQKNLRKELDQLVSVLIDKLSSGEDVDLAKYIRINTLLIMSKLLGYGNVSEKKLERVSDLATKVIGSISLFRKTYSNYTREKVVGYTEEFKEISKEYYSIGIKDKNSLIYELSKLGYSESDTYGFISMFLVAGTVTISSSFPRLIAVLIDTGLVNELKDDDDLIESAINEAFRYITPGTTALYGVKSDYVINGKKYIKGKRIIISTYNILHDKAYTPKPYVYDLSRIQNKQIDGLWFGAGAHFCMGSILAKLEFKLLLKGIISLNGKLIIKERTYRKIGAYHSYEKLVISLV